MMFVNVIKEVIATQDNNHDHFKFPNKYSSGKTYYLLVSVQGCTTPTSALVQSSISHKSN